MHCLVWVPPAIILCTPTGKGPTVWKTLPVSLTCQPMHLTKWMTFQHHFVQLSQNIVPGILKNLRFHELAISHESYLLQVTECMSKNDLTNKRLFFSHIKVSRDVCSTGWSIMSGLWVGISRCSWPCLQDLKMSATDQVITLWLSEARNQGLQKVEFLSSHEFSSDQGE